MLRDLLWCFWRSLSVWAVWCHLFPDRSPLFPITENIFIHSYYAGMANQTLSGLKAKRKTGRRLDHCRVVQVIHVWDFYFNQTKLHNTMEKHQYVSWLFSGKTISEESRIRPWEAGTRLLFWPFTTTRSNKMSVIILVGAFLKVPRQPQNNMLYKIIQNL